MTSCLFPFCSFYLVALPRFIHLQMMFSPPGSRSTSNTPGRRTPELLPPAQGAARQHAPLQSRRSTSSLETSSKQLELRTTPDAKPLRERRLGGKLSFHLPVLPRSPKLRRHTAHTAPCSPTPAVTPLRPRAPTTLQRVDLPYLTLAKDSDGVEVVSPGDERKSHLDGVLVAEFRELKSEIAHV